MSKDQAPAEIVEAARAFLSRFAHVEVDAATANYTEHGNQRVLEFALNEQSEDAAIAESALRKSLGFAPDTFRDTHGEQLAWDLERDRRRVFMHCRWAGPSLIGFCHWD